MQGTHSSVTTSPQSKFSSPVSHSGKLSSHSSRFTPVPRSLVTSPVCGYHSPDLKESLSHTLTRADTQKKPLKGYSASDEKSKGESRWQWKSSDLKGSSKQTVYRLRAQGSEGGAVVLLSEEKASRKQVEDDLCSALKDANEKGNALLQLKGVTYALEQKLRESERQLATMQQENKVLKQQLLSKEDALRAAFEGEIQRLSRMLTESSAKFAHLSVQLTEDNDTKPSQDSEDLCQFLIDENRRLSDELTNAKVTLQTQFSSVLTALVGELSSIRGTLGQMSILLNCLRSGKQVDVSELIREGGRGKHTDKSSAESLSTVCMREVEAIKKFVVELKSIASEFYAQHCGEVCSAQ